MKRFLAIMMALLMVLSVVACNKQDKKPTTTTPQVTTTPSGTTKPTDTTEPDNTTESNSTTSPDSTTTPGGTTKPNTTTPGSTTKPNATTPVTTTKPTETTVPGGTTSPDTSNETVWDMPTDWSVATEKDKNGWVMPYIGQWKLLGYIDLNTATPKLTDSSISISDYRAQQLKTGGHGKLPGPYFGVHDNEAAIQCSDTVAYKKGGWYTNWNQRWSGKTFSATADDSGIYAIAHAGKPGAIVFTAPVDGDYTYTETVEQLLFVAGGTNLSFEVTVRKNGQVLTSFVPTSSNKVKTLTGIVTLKAGDVLMFAIEQKTNVTFSSSQTEHKSNDPNCFKITNVSVTQHDHVCSSDTVQKHNNAPSFCAPGVSSYYSCYCGKLYKDANAKTILTEKDHVWNNGTCSGCGNACKHNVTASDATCHKAAVCGICGYVVAPITAGNHKDTNGTYTYVGNVKHRFNRTCCDATDIALEACVYGNDNICDKCGNDKTKNNEDAILIAMANQTKNQIQLFDITTGNMNNPVWSYNITVGGVSGFKIRNYSPYGDVLLVTVGTKVEMVAVDTKEVVWSTTNAPGNAHSLDIMPNGIIAVGGTVGHCVNFYNINGTDPTKILYTLPLQHAHGVLWDPEYNVLWVTGATNLWALNVTLNADGTVKVEKNTQLTAPSTPDTDTHDLQPYRGDKNKLLVSTHHYLYVYDKVEKTYTAIVDEDAIKGVGNTVDGDLFYMYHDNQGEGWNTTYIEYVEKGSTTPVKIYSDQGRFYKCRLWDTSYQ
ncbi:MAG: hypothetical protein J6D09_01530 [Clostridia bacterium]|nr:hypothetical protein [Clostridia bacterium]